ncbi:hypothetical protein MHYP_G00277130 [Metynnis hypsauchen]
MEEIREVCEGEARMEAERNLMKIILPELQRNILASKSKMQEEFSRQMEEKDRELETLRLRVRELSCTLLEEVYKYTAEVDEFKLFGPCGAEKYQCRSAVTLSCHLSTEISAVAMEIRWFKGTDCVCLYKNRKVTEGRGYEGRVSLFTQELQRGNVSLQIRNCRGSDGGDYLCQVTNGDTTEECTVNMWGISLWTRALVRLGARGAELTNKEASLSSPIQTLNFSSFLLSDVHSRQELH